ncbi:heterokaryon incompatibility protein-domain-containing protein [Xylogone sp. PMI_703]|nr:heterokaryon incompatibility protein-domain-containing protein [Xylogone sp. PMI_703]
MAAGYVYRPLKENEIRVLELFSGSQGDQISCRLVHVSLSHNPSYEAVSYTWGNESQGCSIQIDGKVKRVTPNVLAILREYRRDCSGACSTKQNAEETAVRILNVEREDLYRAENILDLSSHHGIKVEELTIATTLRDIQAAKKTRSARLLNWHDVVLANMEPEARSKLELIMFNRRPSHEKTPADGLVSKGDQSDLPLGQKEFESISIPHSMVDHTLGSDSVETSPGDGITSKQPLSVSITGQESFQRPSSRFLWIDAICIDQNNIEERNEQVLLMNKIYSQAEGLLIWLGEEDEWSRIAVASISMLSSRYRHCNAAEGDSCNLSGTIDLIEGGTHAKTANDAAQRWFRESQDSEFLTIMWHSLATWFSRPWFLRVWIIQEYIVGKKDRSAIFYCGSCRLSEQELKDFDGLYSSMFSYFGKLKSNKIQALEVEISRTLRLENASAPPSEAQLRLDGMYPTIVKHGAKFLYSFMALSFSTGVGRWTSLFGHRQNKLLRDEGRLLPQVERASRWNGLLYYLTIHRAALSTDPRDKIYALLGLAMDRSDEDSSLDFDPSLLLVDYRKSTQDVFASLVQSIERRTGRLDILITRSPSAPKALVGYTNKSSDVQPTWVPDWTQPTMGTSISGTQIGTLAASPFNADARSSTIATFSDDLTVLTVKGILWGCVSAVSIHGQDEDVVDLKETCKAFLDIMITSKIFNSTREAKESLWRNLTLNGSVISNRAQRQIIKPHELGSVQPLLSMGQEVVFDTWLCRSLNSLSYDDPNRMGSAAINDRVHDHPNIIESFQSDITHGLERRQLVLTGQGYVGQVPNETRVNDIICVILGCASPLVLRAMEGGKYYELVGEAYFHEIMNGEIIELLGNKRVELKDFELH